MANPKVSRSFWLDEFTVSATAARAGRKVEVPPHILINIERLANTVLQPLRDSVKRPIVLISGYRPPWLNKMVGGSTTSAHMQGMAADLIIPGMTTFEICTRVKKLDLPVDQCIEEFGRWVHLGISAHQVRRQYITARKVNINGKLKTVYGSFNV